MVSATVANDGGLQSPLDVRGDLTLTIDDPSAARVDIHIAPSADHKGFNFKARTFSSIGFEVSTLIDIIT